jgi:hypothetical protein
VGIIIFQGLLHVNQKYGYREIKGDPAPWMAMETGSGGIGSCTVRVANEVVQFPSWYGNFIPCGT